MECGLLLFLQLVMQRDMGTPPPPIAFTVARESGRHKQPTAGCLDSQSIKCTAVPGERGYDAGKKINGRKRHILVDTLGLLLAVVVTTAGVQDRDGARLLLRHLPGGCKKPSLLSFFGHARKYNPWI